MDEKLYERALAYHKKGVPGKIKVVATKPLTTQEDLALAYSPGVAAPCEAIVEDELVASEVTARGNLVAVITNGTAVLGLGAIGPLAAKPVMEGKAVLFKKFAGIDVFDIEIDQLDPDKLVDTIASLEPTFGGINLEDIKAPECFYIESELKKRMKIPVFHDDQHGTAIITSAGMINALFLVDKDISEIKLVTSGAGAAGMACLDLLVNLGLRKENIIVTDSRGVIYKGRTDYMDDRKEGYAVDTTARTLADAIQNADAFLGVSAPGVLTQDMVKTMAKNPIIFALANPVPEIMPELAREARPDAIIATGRSDYPNQVNNVLCFPYMFRGALDVGATSINEEMKMATVHALAELARKELSEFGNVTDEDDQIGFGPEYLIPQPFDPRLLASLAPAIAKAAMDSGVATRPIRDMQAYKETLSQYVFRSGLLMKPLFDAAKKEPLRVCFAEGEEPVVLRAVQVVIDEGLARPVLIGRPRVVEMRIKKLGLRIRIGDDFELVEPEDDPRFRAYWQHYHALKERKGVTPDLAKKIVRTRTSVIAAIMLSRGEIDAMLCGVVGRYHRKMSHIKDVIGVGEGKKGMYALSAMANDKGTYFFCDTYVNCNPNAEEIAECTLLAAHELSYFGVVPKVALLSHSNFGSHDDASARKMREALQIIRRENPDLEVEGEMQADAALSEIVRQREFPNSRLKGSANLFVFPSLGSANIAFSLAREIGDAVSVGPILMGAAKSAHVMTPEISVRGIVNMTAVAVVDALRRK